MRCLQAYSLSVWCNNESVEFEIIYLKVWALICHYGIFVIYIYIYIYKPPIVYELDSF